MANQEQLAILKQGVKVWNAWREDNPTITIDLSNANFSKANLSEANFTRARLNKADFSGASLTRAELSEANLSAALLSEVDFSEANLRRAYLNGSDLHDVNFHKANLRSAHLALVDLRGAILSKADLSSAFLRGANLVGANLTGATLIATNLSGKSLLSGVDLSGANLSSADLRGCDLSGAFLSEAILIGTDFSGASLGGSSFLKATVSNTIFGNSDLSTVIGLEDIVHQGPSLISTDTFALSKGKIPEVFLLGCGLSDADIEYAKLSNSDLGNEEISKILYKMYDVRASQAIQISPLFISYSHSNASFVDKLEAYLNKKGIRFWRDVHHAIAGRLEKQIDRAMRLNPTVLLILSEHSVKSDWVEHEVRTARDLEKEIGRDVLCPVALDDSWKDSPWPKRVMEQVMEYNILDFSAWQNESKFGSTFDKLIDGLELFYRN